MPFDAEHFTVTEVPAAPVARDPSTITNPRERIAYLSAFLRDLPEQKFNMTTWAQRADADSKNAHLAIRDMECGTTACIGGWTNTLWPQEWRLWDSTRAMDTLGLTLDQGQELFFGAGTQFSITSSQAADVLDHYLATGEVDWSVAT